MVLNKCENCSSGIRFENNEGLCHCQCFNHNHDLKLCDRKCKICDCCGGGYNRKYKNIGLCHCICSKCDNLLRLCRYSCYN